MRTREEQIAALAFKIGGVQASNATKQSAEAHILEAERRAEQRVRAEIGRDSERLDWLGDQDVIIGKYNGKGWEKVFLARYQISCPADLIDIRFTIDAARNGVE